MSNYEIFEKIIKAYKDRNDGAMKFYTMQLLSQETGNPYQLGYKEADIFASLPACYVQSQSGRVGSRKASVDIGKRIKQILDISTMNPYSKENFFKQDDPEKKEVVETAQQKTYVFGVVEKEINEVSEPVEEPSPEETTKVAEENKKRIFGRHKKR